MHQTIRTAIAVGVLACGLPLSGAENPHSRGALIYRNLCVSCHGEDGRGVADKYDKPLVGDRSIESLKGVIHRTMPEEDADQCRDDDALEVAKYIYDAFYSPVAQARNMPARIDVSRLTVRQYLNTVADLAGSFSWDKRLDDRRGLEADYYKTRRYDRKEKAFERIDGQVDFDFGEGTPEGAPEGQEFKQEEFSIRWEGSIIAEETGDYEFCVKSENGARLWVNHMDDALIDAWVASGGQVREHRETVRLLGGRVYPIRLEFFKFKDKTASIELRWKPPHRVEEVIPERCLTPERFPDTLIVSTPFPPDDSSVGYERGTAVSKAWDQAATHAAIEVADHVAGRLDSFGRTKKDAQDRDRKIRDFARQFVERAFRRPLSDEQRKFFIDAQFEAAAEPEIAIKRIVLLALKSPRFLYPELKTGKPDAFEMASRLSFYLWDSLPDEQLFKAAREGKLSSPEEVAAQARRMLEDPRARAKMRYFFHHWLRMNEAEEIAKDTQVFPGFDDRLITDLRISLDLFVDDVVWSEASDFRQLLLADHMFLNDRLAEFYGAKDKASGEFRKIAFDPKTRSGVITHPYLLSTFAYRDATSPIHRGVFVTRNMLGRTLNPPPNAIEFEDSKFDPKWTMRKKVAELTKPRACQTCHSIINPLGFSLEHYDAVGRFRDMEKSQPIDASGVYKTGDGGQVKLTGARDLAEYAAGSEAAQRGFIIQLFNQTVKQPVQAYGPDALDKLHKSFQQSNYNIRKLLIEIVQLAAPFEAERPGADARQLSAN